MKKLKLKDVETPEKTKFHLKTYQKVIIWLLAVMLVVATFVLVIHYWEDITSSSTRTLITMIVVIVLIGVVGLIGYYLLYGKER